jgi:hypothetical protein
VLDVVAGPYLPRRMCPVLAHPGDQLLRLEAIAEGFRRDGAIYHVLKGSFLRCSLLSGVRECPEVADTSVAGIETQYGRAGDEVLRTRPEAFRDRPGYEAGLKGNQARLGLTRGGWWRRRESNPRPRRSE